MTDIGSVTFLTSEGDPVTIAELTALFDLCAAVLDARRPEEVAALRPALDHVDRSMSGADCTVATVIVHAGVGDAVPLLGELAGRMAVLVDPRGDGVTSLGVTAAPALVWVTTEPAVAGRVEGWDPVAWDDVLDALAHRLAWTPPFMPPPEEPAPFSARPLREPDVASDGRP